MFIRLRLIGKKATISRMAKRQGKRKSARRSRAGGRSELTTGIHMGGPLASALVMDMQYFHSTLLNESFAGVGAFNQYRLNSLYDPDLSGTGKQPLGFDQYSTLYGRYRVLKAKIEVTLINRTDSAFGNYVAVVWPSAQASITSDPESWPAQPLAKYKLCSVACGGGAVNRFGFTVNIPRLLGVTSAEFKDADFSSITSASPTRVAYLHVGIYGVGYIVGATLATKITFTSEWSQPVTLALS